MLALWLAPRFASAQITTQTVDSAGSVGRFTSVAAVDGKPAISYYDDTNGDLKFARNSAANGSGTWTITTVDSTGTVGLYTSLAVVAGNPAITYYDQSNSALKFARNSAADGSGTWTITTVDAANTVGLYTSLAIVDGNPAIAYVDATNTFNNVLKFARNSAADGSGTWAMSNAGSAGGLVKDVSLAVVGGNPAISFRDESQTSLRFTRNSAADGSGAWTATTVDNTTNIGSYTSLAVLGGKPGISYTDSNSQNLMFARNAAADGSGAWTTSRLLAYPDSGQHTSLSTINGYPVIAFYDSFNFSLKVAVNSAADASGTWRYRTVDTGSTSGPVVGPFASIKPLGTNAIVSYFDDWNDDLKFAFLPHTPDIVVKGNGTEIANGATATSKDNHTDFLGLPLTGGNTTTRTFTITSNGLADLTLAAGAITLSGTHAADFSISGVTLPATVPMNDNLTFTVTFSPTALGTRSATINIASDDPDENPFSFAIQGTGVTPIVVSNANGSGAGSLRQAVIDVAEGGVITFDSTFFSTARTIASTATLDITKSITIFGPGAARVTLSGGNTRRVLQVGSGTLVRLTDVTIANGSDASQGGGIQNNGALTMTDCAVTGCTSPQGGGIENDSVLTMLRCLVASNTSGGTGGGLNIYGTTTLTNCTFTSNVAANSGGAISTAGTAGALTITNCTIVNNQGGDTVSLNALSVVITNTIVAQNVANNVEIGGSYGNELYYAGTNNLIDTPNLRLSALGSYGGSTQTIALLPGSPAIDAGTATGAPTSDARGVARVGATDIGAYESRSFTLSVTSGGGQSVFAGGTFANPIVVTVTGTSGDPVAGGVVTFTPPASGATVGGGAAATVTIAADGTASLTPTSSTTVGSYSIAVSAVGAPSGVSFNLTNIEGPEISVEAPALTVIADGGTVDFGSIARGASSAPMTFTIRNSGAATLTGLAITKDGVNASEFAVSSLSATTLATGATATFTVTFTAGGADFRTCALHIANNDVDESPYDLLLGGTGLTSTPLAAAQEAYAKASAAGTTQAGDQFGYSVAVSGDTVIVGAPFEDGGTGGINPARNETAADAGGAFVFFRSGSTWTQQAFLKASDTTAGDKFGTSVSISGDTAIVGAPGRSSSAGVVYVFVRSGTTWTQQASLLPIGPNSGDQFGASVAASGDVVVVGAPFEDGSAAGVNGGVNDSQSNSGAAYVFRRAGTTWTQEAYLKQFGAFFSMPFANFGNAVAIYGNTIVVGAEHDQSSTTGVNSTPGTGATNSGAALVFVRNGPTWTAGSYLKAHNTTAGDLFGHSVAVWGDTIAVGAPAEDSSTTGVDSTSDEAATDAGAVYVFARSGGAWTQQACVKAGNTGAGDAFGQAVALSGDTLVVGAPGEDSGTTGTNSTPDETAAGAGAVYQFTRSGATWTQRAYLKPANTDAADGYGGAVAVAGIRLVVGANLEDSASLGVNSTANNTATDAGAAYILAGVDAASVPTISNVADLSINEDTATSALAVTLADNDTALTSLTLTGASSNTTLVPNANIVFAGSGANRTVTVTPAANQTGTATITLTVSDGTSTATDTFVLTVNNVNDAPTISNVANTSTAEDTPTSAIAVTVGDIDTAVTDLVLTGSSSNTTLVPNANIVLGGSGASRTVTVTPAPNQNGTATITLTVSDGALTATDTFTLTVTAVADAPTISDVADVAINEDGTTGAIAFTIGDAETAATSLTVTRASSNTTLVPLANVVLGGSGANRTVTITPVANLSGTSTITLTVSDGALTATDTFVVTVNPVNDAPTISNIADTITPAGVATSALAFTIGDQETAAASLTVTATSSNTTLVPNANLVLGGSGASRTLTVTPSGSLTGTATITVTVSDGTATASDTFVLTVTSNVIVVTNTNNTGAGSLRQALIDTPAGGTITFDPTFFATPRTITLSSTLTITKNVTITGPGASQLTISGNNAVGCFTMESISSVSLSDLTIAQGRAVEGGAIRVGASALSVTRCVFRQHTATSNGGAIMNDGGSVSATDCTFTGNTSTYPGAAIYSGSPWAAHCVVTRCTFSGQTGAYESLYIQNGSGCLVTNCTFSDNSGSLVCALTASGGTSATITNCTIVGNTGSKAVFVYGSSSVVMKNCLVAGNSGYDYNGEALAAGSVNNLFGTTIDHGLVDGVNGNRVGVTNPLVAPLGSYGGPTQTRPPFATSPAINAGTATGAPATDQRGVARPQGAAVDMGAVEQSVAITPTTVAGGTQNSAYTPITFSASGGTSPYTWALLSGALPAGMTFNTATQTLSGTPTAGGTFTFALSATDAGGFAGAATYTLAITALAPPTISDVANLSTAEDTPTSALAFTVGDVETPTASLTVTATSSNQTLLPNANLVLGGSDANRTVTATPAANQAGTATITLTVTDGDGLTATDTFVLTVTAVNDAPTISDVVDIAINEDTTTGALPFTIGDVETAATSLTVTRASSNTALVPLANVVLGGSGASRTVTVTPAANQSGTATITLTVSDGALTAVDTFVMTVNPVNDAPTISNVSDVTISEDTATTARPVTVGDIDTPVASLVLTGSSSNQALVPDANITFGGSGASRTVTVTPAPNAFGTATITLTVSDGALTATDTFVITVNGLNDAPTISTIAPTTIAQNTATSALAFTVGDLETAASSLSVTASSSNQTLVPNTNLVLGGSGANRTIVITPATNQSGTATITLRVNDGVVGTASTFVLTVTAVNQAPTITGIADATINEDASSSGLAFTIGDAETAASSLTLSGSSSNTTLIPNASIAFGGSGANRTVTVTPAANQSGTANITVTVSDGTLTASDVFVVTVNAVNDTPTITAISNTAVAEDTATSALAFTVDDVETAAAALTVSGSSSNQTLVPNANIVFGGSGASRTVTVTPAANASGTATITVNVSDGAATGTRTFLLTVTAVNDAPTLSDLTDLSTAEDTATAAIPFTIGDVETSAAALIVSASSSNPALVPNGNLALGGSGANRTLTVTPAANQSGTSTITVTVSDGAATTSDTFVLTVTAVNDAPTISNIADRSTNIDTSTGAIAFTIGDVETAAGSLTLSATSSNTTVVPNANLVFGGSGTARTLTIMPAAGQTGTTTITVTVDDGTTTTSDTFILTVANGAPTISAITDTTIAEDATTGTIAFTVGDNETSAALLTVSGVSDNTDLVPDAAIVFGGSGSNRTVTIAPAGNQSGTATITVTANDGVLTGSTSFLLTVTAVNDVPTISDVADTATAEDTSTAPLAFTVGDIETAAGALVVTATSSNTALVPDANLVLGGSGATRTLTATPAANQSGSATITVTVSDGSASASDTFVLTVNAVNDTPTISGIPDTTVNEDTTTAALAFTVSDVETAAASLAVTATSSNTALVPNAALVLGGSGASRTITATPAANQSGTTTITVTVSDGTSSASDTFVLTVNAVNDAPTISDITDRATNLNTATAPIAFTIDDVETAAASLTVIATSSNPAVVPDASLALGGTGAARTLTITPAANQTGSATITVTVSDGSLTASDTFVLTVSNGAPTISAIADLSVAEDTATSALAFTVADNETAPAAIVVTATSDNVALVPNASLTLGGTGANRTLVATPAANASGTATITLSASDGLLTGTTSFVLTVTAVNDTPTISDITDVSTNEGTPTPELAFLVGDVETPAASLTVSASSSNPALVPNTPTALALAGSDTDRTLVVTPLANQSGTTTITVTVSDGVATSSDTFVLTVVAGLPTVTTPTSDLVAATTATLGGNVTADGGSAITARGVVVAIASVNPNPRLLGTGVTDFVGTGTAGVFTVGATALAPNTTYAYAAYATNTVGTAYSPADTFTTTAPSDTTPPTASITVAASTTLKIGDTTSVTIVFSEPVVGFALDDVSAANGTLGSLATVDNTTFTMTFTPTAGVTAATNVITVDLAGVTDAASNPGVGTSTSNNYAIDTSAPVFTSAAVASGTYRSPFAFTLAATGAANYFASGLPPGLTLNAGTGAIGGAPTAIGTFDVALSATDSAGNHGTASLTITIARASLTVAGLTAANRIYDGTTTATLGLSAAELVGVLGGDAVALNTSAASGAFADKRVGMARPVTVSGLALTGAAAANYSLSPPVPTANITTKELTATGITVANKTHDGTTMATINTSAAALVGVITPDVVTLNAAAATGAFADANVGTNKAVTISGLALTGTDAANYTLVAPTATASITTALSISLGNLARTYDGAPKPVSVNVSGGTGVTTVTYGGSNVAPTNAGSYSVFASVSGDAGSASTSGTLVIAKATPSLSFSLGETAPQVGVPITLAATASSGLPVTFSVVSGNASLNGATLVLNDNSPVTVRASQAGDGNYNSVSVDRTITSAALQAQTITFASPGNKLATASAFALVATASSGLPVTFTIVSGPALLVGSEVTLTGVTGTVVVRASQSGNGAYAAAPDVTVAFTVGADAAQIYFGQVGPSGLDVLAIALAPDGRSGLVTGTIPGTGEAFTFEITIDGAGNWIAVTQTRVAETSGQPAAETNVPARAAAAQTRTLRGRLAGGVITGAIDGTTMTLDAHRAAATGPAALLADGYRATAPANPSAAATMIVGADGRLYALVTSSSYVIAASGTIDASGAFTARSPEGATFSGTVDPSSAAISSVLQRPGFPPESFIGLRRGVLRTDRLINLSSRVRVGPTGNRTLIAGFVVGGPEPKRLLLRAVGPALGGFGIAGALSNPRVQLYDSAGRLLLENDDWTGADVAETSARLGAFALASGSRDAALLTTLAPGTYTMHVLDGGENGVALAEIYDASPNPSSEYQRLINISTRGEAGTGENVLIGGFIVTGNYPKRVLVRGVGPALGAFGLSGVVTDPQLKVFSGATIVGENDDWSATPADVAAITDAARAVGAFALPAGSRDAAVILTLAPGAYTAQVSPANGASAGTGLVEIYEIPE